MVEGIELIGYADLEIMKVSSEYKEKEDYLLFEGKGDFFILIRTLLTPYPLKMN